MPKSLSLTSGGQPDGNNTTAEYKNDAEENKKNNNILKRAFLAGNGFHYAILSKREIAHIMFSVGDLISVVPDPASLNPLFEAGAGTHLTAGSLFNGGVDHRRRLSTLQFRMG